MVAVQNRVEFLEVSCLSGTARTPTLTSGEKFELSAAGVVRFFQEYT
jgi:hypothetical protein